MGLIDQINTDIAKITSNPNEFGVSIEFISPASISATIIGIHTKHHLGIDSEGNVVNTKKASIAFSESVLVEANPDYIIRNTAGEIDLKDHRVNVKDSTGITKEYVVAKWFPDETIGLIVVILSAYE